MTAHTPYEPAPLEFAPGVYQLPAGSGPMRANVYFVRSDAGARGARGPGRQVGASTATAAASWVLIDTGVPGCAAQIRAAAESLFGAGTSPTAILITHAHPDHVGSAADLARDWQCPVYLHAEDVRMVGGDIAHFQRHSFTLDRRLILPLLRVAGKKHIEAIMSRGGLREYAQALGEGAAHPAGAAPRAAAGAAGGAAQAADTAQTPGAVPGLPDWQAIPTPGHTPGHVAFFRAKDRVLISGDAVVTRAEPFSALVGKRAVVSAPPWYFTWNRSLAKQSIARLAELEPLVIAGGHGRPRQGADLPTKLRELAAGR